MIHHLLAASAMSLAGRPLPPPADLVPTIVRDGNHHDGNGHHNRNIISVHSPTHNRGYQHTSNSNAGGSNPVQNALCRHVTVCNVTQTVHIARPERPQPPAETPPEPPPPTVEVLPEPQREAPPPLEPPRQRLPRGPFLYMGPEGLLMGSGAGTPTLSLGGVLPFGLSG
ncbi:hypothetical protein [Actinomadura sp. DC4]|uniref:hypothetical protein n=1 Tax=Actinomadura sp. DC4 TaxID=3055069 RepID=UPI0025B1984B|nr:hypothetical protein [Actinomadura sp. DC4]MDN3351496.1 hypothetical protein [Actinomadura sp. DC4]